MVADLVAPPRRAPATDSFRFPEGGIGLFWGDIWCHKSVNERPRPGAHIPDIFRDELEEDGCKDLIIEAKFQALALENPVDVGEFFVFPDCVRRADITCYLRDLWVVDGASDDLVEGRDWTGERICIRRGMKVSKNDKDAILSWNRFRSLRRLRSPTPCAVRIPSSSALSSSKNNGPINLWMFCGDV